MKSIIFVLLACVSYGSLQAQPVIASFEKDTVTITAGHTFGNRLHVVNPSGDMVRLVLQAAPGGYLRLPDTLVLQPGEERWLPLKFLADAALIHAAIQSFTVQYGSAVTATFYTRLDEAARVVLQLTGQPVLLDAVTNRAQTTVYLRNEGLLPRTIHYAFSVYPQGLEVLQDGQPLTLPAGGRQQLLLGVHRPGRKGPGTDYTLVIQVLDDRNAVLATGDIRIQSLSGSKRVLGDVATAALPPDVWEMNYINMTPALSYLQWRGKGSTSFADSSRLDYKLTFEYYEKSHDQPGGANIYDTWLAYTGQHFALRAGSISDNLDYAINGNGMQATAFLDKQNSIDIYGLRNSYLLYTQVTTTLPGADVAAVRYNFTSLPFRLQVSALHASDPLLDVLANLVHAEAQFRLGLRRSLEMEGGFSTESQRDGPIGHDGGSLGFRYHAEEPHWTMAFNNYYSSHYYSGYRRGALQLDDEVDYKLSVAAVPFLRYSKADNSPKYLPTADSLVVAPFNYNNTDIYEAGYRLLGHGWSIVPHPYYMTQMLYSALPLEPIPLRSRSDRFALDLTGAAHGRALYVSGDIGRTTSDSAQRFTQHYTSIRVQGNYSDRWWSLNWLLQWRPYYLTDELQSAGDPQGFRLYSFSPAVHVGLLQDRLAVSGSYTASYYSVSGLWTQLIGVQANLRLADGWSANGQVDYTLFHGSSETYPANRLVRIGLQRLFAGGGTPGAIRLKLRLFEDRNANGQPDRNEAVAAHVIVRLDGQAALSNSRGEVEFLNLPGGVHQLTIDNGADWNLPQPMTLPLLHDQTVHVALVRSGQLSGQVMIVRQVYERRSPDPQGITVLAVGPDGKSWSTLTDENGRFHFYVPVADYMVSVPAVPGLSGAGAPQRVSAPAEISFKLEDKRRKIEVQQF